MKCEILFNLSTTTNITFFPNKLGKPLMKSMGHVAKYVLGPGGAEVTQEMVQSHICIVDIEHCE